jgi:hypothetical protein
VDRTKALRHEYSSSDDLDRFVPISDIMST